MKGYHFRKNQKKKDQLKKKDWKKFHRKKYSPYLGFMRNKRRDFYRFRRWVLNDRFKERLHFDYNVCMTLTLNNIFLSYQCIHTNQIHVISTGILKPKVFKKTTPFTAQQLIEKFCYNVARKHILIVLKFKGWIRRGIKIAVIEKLKEYSNVTVKKIYILAKIAHNGCRRKKLRRK